jgi:hypothetical protein
MSRRIAHRPRYHFNRYTPQPPRHSHREFLRTHWTYRRQTMPSPKRVPGQSLLLVPWGYRLLRGAIPLIR